MPSNNNVTNYLLLINNTIQEINNLTSRLNIFDDSNNIVFGYIYMNNKLENIMSKDDASVYSKDLVKYSNFITNKFIEFADCIHRGYKYNDERNTKTYEYAQKIKFKTSNIKEWLYEYENVVFPPFKYDKKYITLEQLLIELGKLVIKVTNNVLHRINNNNFKNYSLQNFENLRNNTYKNLSLYFSQMQLIYAMFKYQPFRNKISKINEEIVKKLEENICNSFKPVHDMRANLQNIKWKICI